jgi:hypothetical protein
VRETHEKTFQDRKKKIGTRALATLTLAFFLAAGPALAGKNPLREVYFGETHVHTSWSFDAYIFGSTITGPAEAYKYALGEPIKHPMGYTIKITHPLDWMGVTDHSEYVGTVRLANEPGSAISKLPIAEKLKVKNQDDIQRIFLWLGSTMATDKPVLKDLIVSKTLTLRNNVTGDRYEILYGTTGRRLITRVNGKQPDPGQMGDVLHAGELGSASRYEIKGGQIITTLGNTPYEATVYKVGDKYSGVRSNEFGFANYELVLVRPGAPDAGVSGN